MTAVRSLLAAVGAPPPADADPGDTEFLSSLRQIGKQFPNPTEAITSGKEVCGYLARGHSCNQASREMKTPISGGR